MENFVQRIKRLRRIDTRHDKLGEVFLNFILLAASLDWIHSFRGFQSLFVTGAVVFLMVYVVMPRYTKSVRKWLFD